MVEGVWVSLKKVANDYLIYSNIANNSWKNVKASHYTTALRLVDIFIENVNMAAATGSEVVVRPPTFLPSKPQTQGGGGGSPQGVFDKERCA